MLVRQHFQGLRRAQNKADANGNAGDNPNSLSNQRRIDPTLNPITRRPGPGRGRPRKQPPSQGAVVPASAVADPAVSGTPDGAVAAVAAAPSVEDTMTTDTPVQESPITVPGTQPADIMVPPPADTLVLGPDPNVVDEHAAKRQRIEDSAETSLDDEAVLRALAGQDNPASGLSDHYGPE